MKINHLFYGKAHGLIKLEGSLIDGKNDFYDLNFEHIKVEDVKIEKVEKVNLNEFKLKPFAELKDQWVEFTFRTTNYNIEFEQAVLNNLEVIEEIRTITNERYCKFKGDFFSEISFIELKETEELPKKIQLEKKEKVDQSIKETRKVEIPVLESESKSGCFGGSKKTIAKENTAQQSSGGCFGNNKNYTDVKKFYDVNANYLEEEKKKSAEIRKEYWKDQKRKREEVYKGDYSPFRNIGSSFINSLTLIISIIGLIILSLFVINNQNSSDTSLATFALVSLSLFMILGWFLPSLKSTFRGRIFRWLSTLLSLFVLFISIATLLPEGDDYDYDRDREDDTEIIDDSLTDDDIIPDNTDDDSETKKVEDNEDVDPPKTEKVIKRSLSWKDFERNNYKEEFKTSVTDYNDGKQYLNRLNIPYTGANFWSKLYSKVVRHESKKNKYIKKMYTQLKPTIEGKSLNKRQKLDAIITSVQEIPYYLVHEGSCSQSARQSQFSRQYHQKGEPCLASKKYGLALPSEFSANFKGDCDTRALFLYMFLKQMGYDVAILISEAYGHAILGVNIPGQGKYVKYRGKRYLTLETTSKGWKIGQLPPNCSDTRKWRVALN